MPSIVDPQPSLTLGAIDLLGADKSGPFWFETLSENHDLGNPVPIEREIESLLQDGAVMSVDSYGNRVMTMRVVVCGEDSPGLAAGERELLAELRRRNVLTWTPPNIITGSGDPTVFDVVHSEPSFVFDDMLELRSLQRVYTLTLHCLPHARSPIRRDATLTAPAGVSPTVTTINACTSTAGFTKRPTAAVMATSGGAVTLSWVNPTTVDQLPYVALLTSGLSVSMAGSPFVRIDFATTGSGRYGPQLTWVYLNGAIVTEAASNGSVHWYPFDGATLTSVEVITAAYVSRYGKLSLSVADISRSSHAQDASGSRQIFGTVQVAGSTRTEASLEVFDAAASLGSVLLYTAPNTGTVAQPPLRARRSAGPTQTANTALISGYSSDLGTTNSFLLAAGELIEGTYLLMARVFHASAGTYTLTWATRAKMSGVDLGSAVTGTQPVTLTAGAYTVVAVALMTLPPRTMGRFGTVQIDLTGPAGLTLDEAWIFDVSTGVLSWVECGTGSPTAGGDSSRLWLEPASLDHPTVSIVRGTVADGADAFAPVTSLGSWGAHEFVPPLMNIFAAASNSVAMNVVGSYFPRYFSHVVEDDSDG